MHIFYAVSLRSNATFLRLFGGRVVTNVGDSLYYVATMWLVFELTGSTLFTGVAGFLTRLPSSLQFLFGPLADRYELRRLLVSTQAVQGVAVLLVPAAAAVGLLSVWLLLVLVPLLGFLNQVVYPAQSAALPAVTDGDDELVRANSLFAATGQGTDVVFNAVGGGIIAAVGPVALFLVDSATFGLAVLLFWGVSVERATGVSGDDSDADDSDADDEDEDEHRTDATDDGDGDSILTAARAYVDDIRASVGYVRGSTLTKMYGAATVANFGSGAVFAVLPAYADGVGGAEAYGYLLSAIALGTLVGALGASFVDDYPYGGIVIVGNVVSALAFAAVVVVSSLPVVLVLAFVGTVPIGVNNVVVSSIVQSAVDREVLGRVVAVLQSVTTAAMPVGNLAGGAVGSVTDPVDVVLLLATIQALVAVAYLLDSELRTIPAVDDVDAATLGLPSSAESVTHESGTHG